MIKVLLVLHVFVTIALIGVVLIQRSEGGGLGLGGGQGMGNFMTGRGTANLLTRTTAILGTAFFVLSLGLALLYQGSNQHEAPRDPKRRGTEHPRPVAPRAPASAAADSGRRAARAGTRAAPAVPSPVSRAVPAHACFRATRQ